MTLIIFLVNRHDSKKNVQGKLQTLEKEMQDKFQTLERDGLRTQLLMLILLKPKSKQEIMELAQHYFADLHGDWYMTDIFNHWLTDAGDSAPEWFNKEN